VVCLAMVALQRLLLLVRSLRFAMGLLHARLLQLYGLLRFLLTAAGRIRSPERGVR
jgi:hypothetical protein